VTVSFGSPNNSMQPTALCAASDLERWDDLRSGLSGTDLARPHHLWYSKLIGRPAAWEFTLSYELSSSVLKEAGSQLEIGSLI
jgi:hypothetical protein